MTGREFLQEYNEDLPFDPMEVSIDDEDAFEYLNDPLQRWWADEFGQYIEENGGFFTPPQKEAIPHISERDNTLVASPTGSGKCVKPETPILIEENGRTTLVQAKELLEKTENESIKIAGGELNPTDVRAYSFNEDTGDIENTDTNVFSQDYDGELITINTNYGRSVSVTPDHPLLVETGTGYEWRPARDVSDDDRIGVPQEIDLPNNVQKIDYQHVVNLLTKHSSLVIDDTVNIQELSSDNKRILSELTYEDIAQEQDRSPTSVRSEFNSAGDVGSDIQYLIDDEMSSLGENEVLVSDNKNLTSRLNIPTCFNKKVAFWVSFIIAEGHVRNEGTDYSITVSRKNREGLLNRFIKTTEEVFGITPNKKKGTDIPTYTITGKPFVKFATEILKIGSGGSHNVSVPDWVLSAPKDVKKEFISTFFSLEAHSVENDPIELVQANKRSIELLNYLLLSFGVFASIRERKSKATNGTKIERKYHRLTIYGKQKYEFLDTFDLVHPNNEYSLETIDGQRIPKYLFDYTSLTDSYKDAYDSWEDFKRNLGSVYEVTRRSGQITEAAISNVADEAHRTDSHQLLESIDIVSSKKSQNVVFLDVESIKREQYTGLIIDLNVPELHNFVGGSGGMYLHNTLASFGKSIDQLVDRAINNELENSVYCLYISPLKSLANDIKKNLEVPLEGVREYMPDDSQEIRHAIRHGDTSSDERQAMLKETPHILNTTPETLSILLNSPKFKEKLRTVETVIVDEIHSLASNKRGVHLSLSLERLQDLADNEITRVGCSATVEPLDEIGHFLVGNRYDGDDLVSRECEIVDTRFVRDTELTVHTPVDDLINVDNNKISNQFYEELHKEIQDHSTTLVFTNTRSGAESALGRLRGSFASAYDESNSAVHHGSLGKEERKRVEDALKEGTMDVVTTSTSLELGIDMDDVDLVVQVGSPKSIASLLQRIGRAGHQLGETVEGKLYVLDRDELVECTTMAKKANEGHIDRIFVPKNSQDVASQHVYGIAINSVRPEEEVYRLLTQAYPYTNYSREEFNQLLRYLTADYDGLEERNVYAKVWRDQNDPPEGEHHYDEYEVGENLIGKRGRQARVIYYTNIGTIPDSFSCSVQTRSDDTWVGELDEEYLNTLNKGDVVQIGGKNYEYRYRRGSKVYVDRTSKAPTVPSWFSERLPLSYDLGTEILKFQEEIVDKIQSGSAKNWLSGFPIDNNTRDALISLYTDQIKFMGSDGVSTESRFIIEEHNAPEEKNTYYYVQSTYGRKFNDGISRMLGQYFASKKNINVQVAVADQGFSLKISDSESLDLESALSDIKESEVRSLIREGLQGTDFLKRYFRINAGRSLLILRNYKGNHKSAKKQQVKSEMLLGFVEDLDEFAVVEETYREILEDKLNVDKIQDFISAVETGDIVVNQRTVATPSPRSFETAALASEDVIAASDESEALKDFHERVMDEIGD